jgi:hypothetical protein
MIMRKNENSSVPSPSSLSRATHILYVIGMLTIALPLFYLTFEITAKDFLTVYERKVYALALEHILAGITLLTGGCYLVERVSRRIRKEE